jgi:hypothetical protein
MPASKNAIGPIAHLTSAVQPELSPTAYVVAVVARFDTTTDDKDDDTLLRVTLKDPSGAAFAEADNVTGHWDNNSTNYVNLFITSQRQRSQLGGTNTVEVHIDPNGNDTWDFNLTLTVSFSDGIQAQSFFGGHWLSQDNRTNDFPVTNLAG